jgi:hypothetical protein
MERIAHPRNPSTRELRGIALAANHAEEITRLVPFVWSVPSSSGARPYVVNVKTERCNCPDHERTGKACKHLFAAMIRASRRCRV